MLLVKTQVKESEVHGLGLFVDESIAKGAEVWRFTPGFDQRFTREQILAFPPEVQIFLCKFAWKSDKSNMYCNSSDNGKYFNHSENPNVISEYRSDEEEVVTVALRDIAAGEELLDNYGSFESSTNDSLLDEIASRYKLLDERDPRQKL